MIEGYRFRASPDSDSAGRLFKQDVDPFCSPLLFQRVHLWDAGYSCRPWAWELAYGREEEAVYEDAKLVRDDITDSYDKHHCFWIIH